MKTRIGNQRTPVLTPALQILLHPEIATLEIGSCLVPSFWIPSFPLLEFIYLAGSFQILTFQRSSWILCTPECQVLPQGHQPIKLTMLDTLGCNHPLVCLLAPPAG